MLVKAIFRLVDIIWDTSSPSFFLKCGSTNDHAPIFCASSCAQINSNRTIRDYSVELLLMATPLALLNLVSC